MQFVGTPLGAVELGFQDEMQFVGTPLGAVELEFQDEMQFVGTPLAAVLSKKSLQPYPPHPEIPVLFDHPIPKSQFYLTTPSRNPSSI